MTEGECTTKGGWWIIDKYDANAAPPWGTLDSPLCIDPNSSGSYCIVGNSLLYIPVAIGGACEFGGIEYDVFEAPLTDATFLLVFLLGIYGTYIYRKRIAINSYK